MQKTKCLHCNSSFSLLLIKDYFCFLRLSTQSPMTSTIESRYHYPGEYIYKGILYDCHHPVEALKEVEESLTLNWNHVIIASYPKSGHSWQYKSRGNEGRNTLNTINLRSQFWLIFREIYYFFFYLYFSKYILSIIFEYQVIHCGVDICSTDADLTFDSSCASNMTYPGSQTRIRKYWLDLSQ